MSNKTKFIKVSVEEQKPLKSDLYFVIDEGRESTRLFDGRRRRFFGTSQPEFYLQEVPDREEEMREIIQEMILELDPATLSGDYENLIKKAKQLLNKQTV